jgi:homocysteine S-methyltransferase
MPTLIQVMFARLRADKNLVLLLDGGTGEELFRRGVPDDRSIWSATALVNPEYHPILKQVHESFINAGSRAITTNSYGTTPGVGFGMDEIQTLVAVAGKLARESLGDRNHVVVLGSLGPLVESYRPDKIMEHRKGVELYRQMKDALVPFIDAVLAETMSSFEESSQAIEAIGEDVPLLVSYSLNANGCLRSGECATSGISRTLHFAAQHNVNCK